MSCTIKNKNELVRDGQNLGNANIINYLVFLIICCLLTINIYIHMYIINYNVNVILSFIWCFF